LAAVVLAGAVMCGVAALSACVGDDGIPTNDAQAGDTGSDVVVTTDGGDAANLVTLSVSLDGGGAGAVTSTPAGINCGAQCSAGFASGTSVTLTAAPDASSSLFTGWSGDCSSDGTCMVTTDKARNVGATFELHGSHRWIDQISFAGADSIDYLAVDGSDDIIAVGMAGTGSLYVKKYGSDGTKIWDVQIPSDCSISDGGLAVDSAGSIYLGVTISGFGSCTTLGGFPVTGDLFGDVGVLQLAAADGKVQWVKHFGGNGQDRPHALAVSGTNLLVAGESSSTTATFGSYNLSESTGYGFLAKLDTGTGTVGYAKALPGNIQIWDMAASTTDVLVVGEFHTNMTIDGKAINVSSGAHGDVMIYDFAIANPLTAQWARGAGDATGDDTAYAAVAMPGGGWAITGIYYGNINFQSSGTSLPSAGGGDVFLARYDAAGTYVYQFGYGGTGTDVGDGVAVDTNGNLFLAGRFASNITFGAFTLTGASNTDVFLTKLSAGATPVHQWATKYGGTAYDDSRDLAVDSKGNPYVLAQWTGMTVVDGVSLTSQDYDAWVLAAWR
jgi:hypothetical protein